MTELISTTCRANKPGARLIPAGNRISISAGSETIRDFFIPIDYRRRCAPEYISFRTRMGISNVFDSALKLFTTQAIFTAIGLSAGTVSTVALAWTLKDIIGKIGKFGASFAAKKIDNNPPRWYFRGKSLTQAGDLMDLASPIIPGAFVPLTVMSKIAQSAAETINTCSIANIDRHMAQDNNLAEVKSRNGNQDIITSLIGLGMGIALQSIVVTHPWLYPIILLALLAGQSIAVRKATEVLEMPSGKIDRIGSIHQSGMHLGK